MTGVCARQTLGIVVIIDLHHGTAHTVMGKCQNWTDQRHSGSTVGQKCSSRGKGDRAELATCFLWQPLMGVLVYVGIGHLASHFCLQLRNTGIQNPATLPTPSRDFLRARSSLKQACLAVFHWRKLVVASCLRVYHWLALFRGSAPLAVSSCLLGRPAGPELGWQPMVNR